MSAVRVVIRVSLVVIASIICAMAMARDVASPVQAGVRQPDSPEYPLFRSPLEDENFNHVWADDASEQQWSESVVISDQMTPAADRQGFADPSTTCRQDECTDGCCSSCCYNPCPTCYAMVEAVFMRREPQFDRQAIVVDPDTGTTFLSTSDLDYDCEPGLRATVGMHVCDGPALEFSYFGLSDGSGSAFVVRPDDEAFLTFPGNLFGNVFVGMDRVDVNLSSSLNSLEANLLCCCGCCDECGCGDQCGDQCGWSEVRCRSREWFGGFRYLNVDEELNISAQRIVAGEVEEGSYDIRTTNHLYGIQVGARERRTRGRWGWEATGKVGVFGNDASQEQSVTDFPDFELRPTVSDSGSRVAFIGEANLSALYRLTEIWNLRAGYSVIWIEGLALAPDQLDFDFASSPSGDRLDNDGAMFLHGANVGVEARW